VRAAAGPWTDRIDVITARSRPAGALADVDAVLVRPDGYIAWVAAGGSGEAGLSDALSRWFGQPAARHLTARPATAGAQL
jgi:bifunctional hydroxylase/dehydrase